MRRPHATPREPEVQKFSPVVILATYTFSAIVGLLFVGFVIGAGINLANAIF